LYLATRYRVAPMIHKKYETYLSTHRALALLQDNNAHVAGSEQVVFSADGTSLMVLVSGTLQVDHGLAAFAAGRGTALPTFGWFTISWTTANSRGQQRLAAIR
jgi:hypothetical protein